MNNKNNIFSDIIRKTLISIVQALQSHVKNIMARIYIVDRSTEPRTYWAL